MSTPDAPGTVADLDRGLEELAKCGQVLVTMTSPPGTNQWIAALSVLTTHGTFVHSASCSGATVALALRGVLDAWNETLKP